MARSYCRGRNIGISESLPMSFFQCRLANMIRFKIHLAFLTGLLISFNISAREATLLDSGWRFKQGDFKDAKQPAFDDHDWQAISVPHNWGWESFEPKAVGNGTQKSAKSVSQSVFSSRNFFWTRAVLQMWHEKYPDFASATSLHSSDTVQATHSRPGKFQQPREHLIYQSRPSNSI
jgi:hypothetical protein